MVYIMSGSRMESGPLNYDAVYGIAKKKNIPVFTDAAAEMLTIPNIYLQRGSTFVGYSGGKCLRGPQCSGLCWPQGPVPGRMGSQRAASWPRPRHEDRQGGDCRAAGRGRNVGPARPQERGRDVDAVDADHCRPRHENRWRQRRVREPRGIGNHSPGLSINWDPAKLGITGEEVSNILWTTEPRVALGGGGGGGGGRGGRGGASNQTGISITAYMMMPDDVKVVADRVLQSSRPSGRRGLRKLSKTPAADLTGRWDVRIQFAAGKSEHTLYVKQQGNQLVGTHQGDFVARDFTGTISGEDVRISSSIGEVHGAALSYRFTGKLQADTMSGALDMGEYLGAKWTAARHSFGRGDQG